jgi:hypothetical protein
LFESKGLLRDLSIPLSRKGVLMFATVCVSGNPVNNFKKSPNGNALRSGFPLANATTVTDSFNKQAIKFGRLSPLEYWLNTVRAELNKTTQRRDEKKRDLQELPPRFSPKVRQDLKKDVKRLNKDIEKLERKKKHIENRLGRSSTPRFSFPQISSSQLREIRSNVSDFIRSSL